MQIIKTFVTSAVLFTSVLPSYASDDEMPDDKVYRYYNAKVISDPAAEVRHLDDLHGEIWVRGSKIIEPREQADVSIDMEGNFLAPGYIDLQINGAFGVDFSRSPERVAEVAKQLTRFGVTSFLPTLVSLKQEEYPLCMPHLQPKAGGAHGANILGMHLEGPFLSKEQCGAHDHGNVLGCAYPDPKDFYGSLEGVRMVTLAPEVPEAHEAIGALYRRGIIVSAGHTNASYMGMFRATAQGLKCATHLFNAMPFNHRDPGVVARVLNHDDMFYSVIVDRHHLHPATINLARKAHPKGLILVTDAMAAMGLGEGSYTLGSMKVDVTRDLRATISGTNTLAGSVLSMDEAVLNLVGYCSCPWFEAIEAATLSPARLLGIANTKGTLNVGADADFIALNEELEVLATYVLGKKAF